MPKASRMEYNDPFPFNLRNLMTKRHTTQTELAEYVGVARQSISQYMDGSAQPVISKLVKIADYFSVSTDYLLGLIDRNSQSIENSVASGIYGLDDNALKTLRTMNDKSNPNNFLPQINFLFSTGTIFRELLEAMRNYHDKVLQSHNLQNQAAADQELVDDPDKFFQGIDKGFDAQRAMEESFIYLFKAQELLKIIMRGSVKEAIENGKETR